jgi:hypothetical protein
MKAADQRKTTERNTEKLPTTERNTEKDKMKYQGLHPNYFNFSHTPAALILVQSKNQSKELNVHIAHSFTL